ncbi:hypothetical protein DLM86_18550 [Paenibacillus flagellatus]|uniref:DUF6273 domain-containing protein n=2 Tax=Paenibacillus flagellatus TaxID=2211139 RepID=A0A2V5K1L8_9BACL|nr:hypothetical protein DLM86_18550 [Paenibacillus flagellatus]
MEKGPFAFTYRSLKTGDFITFGTYPQSADGKKRAITWRVLQRSGSELFVLSEYILDCKRYHGKSADLKWRDGMETTWRDCDLRQWLNDEFYNAAFTAAEMPFVKTTRCTDNGEGCPDTEDKVFPLSAAEIQTFSGIHGKEWRGAVGTDFAKTKKPDGCSLYVYDKTKKEDYIVRDGEEVGCSWWWLRTRGNKPSRAYFVGTGRSIRSYGSTSIDHYGVRPALILNLP